MGSPAQAWFTKLLSEWESAWDKAGPALQGEIANSLCYLLAPLQGHLYVAGSTSPKVHATVLLLFQNPGWPHGEFKILEKCDSGAWSGDSAVHDWAMRCAEASLANMLENWLPSRDEGLPLHRAIWMQRMDGEFPCTAWTIPGDVTEIDVNELIGEQVRRCLNRPEPVARIEDPRPHISRLHATREPVSTTRWLTINAHNLTVAFGIAEPFWCGLFLPRKALFDVRLDGDIDFLAGPLELEVDEDEWRLRLEEECRRHHIGVARSVVVHHCWMRAAEDGLLRWPPRLKLIAACEMKASWFDAEKGTWHATHVREGPRVKGQLELLLRFGLDRVGFLHLGATKPRAVESINPWFLAGHDAAIARKTMPFVFAPNEMPQCGYFQAVVGSVPFACEDLSGAGGRLTVHQESPALASPAQDWRGGLFRKLAELPKPRSLRAFIRACPHCGQWQLATISGTTPCLACQKELDVNEEHPVC